MSNYTINNLSETVGYISATLVATAMFLNVQALPVERETSFNLKGSAYQSLGVSSTIGQYDNLCSGGFMSYLDPFVGAMSDFYANLLINQEELEPEFASILNDNLWDLYES